MPTDDEGGGGGNAIDDFVTTVPLLEITKQLNLQLQRFPNASGSQTIL